MSMEKYGVSLSELPPTDEHLRELKKLCRETGTPYIVPKSAEEANELIEKLASKE